MQYATSNFDYDGYLDLMNYLLFNPFYCIDSLNYLLISNNFAPMD